MTTLLGLGKLSRERLSEISRQTKGSITTAEAAKILNISPSNASKILSYWAKQGWLSRIQRGFYLPVPLEAKNSDVAIDSPWNIAEKMYSPCYIGGWSAAEYWGLTEQTFRTIVVMTTKRLHSRTPTFKNIMFQLHTISSEKMFGLKPVWQDQIKLQFSDPTRTLLDILSDPGLGGGIRSVLDIFQTYLKSEHKNTELLIQYADKLNNGSIFKRLGYLAEQFFPEESKLIEACKTRLTKGYAKLDNALPSEFLITRWNLWISKNYKKEG